MKICRGSLLVAALLGAWGCGSDSSEDSSGQGGSGNTGGGGNTGGAGAQGGVGGQEATLPVTAVELVSGTFGAAEGITFNGEGRLFVVADTDLHEVMTDGSTSLIADLIAPVGLAAQGGADILVGEFGPLSFPSDGANTDGLVLRVTTDGAVSTVATGIGDPNFITVRGDGSLLVSDDFTDIIYGVASDGTVTTFLQGIQSPNGMVETLDGSQLLVAQTFSGVDPIRFDSSIWSVPLTGGNPGTPALLVELDGIGANDGVALDAEGRLYVAANVDGKVWRVDPDSGDATLVAEGLTGVASLAFGEGEFNHGSIYATQLLGGRIWEIPVGVEGAAMNR